MNGVVLAVDIGTSSLKAALIDARGTVIASARCRFPSGPRKAVHWTDAFAEAFFHVSPALKSSGKKLDAISVSGNGPTLVAVDESDGAFEILMWNDPVAPAAGDRTVGESTGAARTISADAPKSKSLFIPRLEAYREFFPDSWNASKLVLSGPEYLIRYLTGEAVTVLPDPRYKDAYWTDESLSSAGIDAKKLAPFVIAGTIVGSTGNTGRANSGNHTALRPCDSFLPANVPVVAGGPDFTVALVGTGTIKAGTACDRAGTSEGLNVCVEKPVTHSLIRPLPAAVSGLWNAAYLLPDTGARFHAWRAQSGQGSRPYTEIMRAVMDDIENGRESERRTIVEDIGRSVRKGVALLEETTGYKPTYALSGGQARNAIWNRMKAAMANATFAMMETPDGELMGDAALAYASLGAYRSLEDAVGGMVRVAEVYGSEKALASLFEERFSAV